MHRRQDTERANVASIWFSNAQPYPSGTVMNAADHISSTPMVSTGNVLSEFNAILPHASPSLDLPDELSCRHPPTPAATDWTMEQRSDDRRLNGMDLTSQNDNEQNLWDRIIELSNRGGVAADIGTLPSGAPKLGQVEEPILAAHDSAVINQLDSLLGQAPQQRQSRDVDEAETSVVGGRDRLGDRSAHVPGPAAANDIVHWLSSIYYCCPHLTAEAPPSTTTTTTTDPYAGLRSELSDRGHFPIAAGPTQQLWTDRLRCHRESWPSSSSCVLPFVALPPLCSSRLDAAVAIACGYAVAGGHWFRPDPGHKTHVRRQPLTLPPESNLASSLSQRVEEPFLNFPIASDVPLVDAVETHEPRASESLYIIDVSPPSIHLHTAHPEQGRGISPAMTAETSYPSPGSEAQAGSPVAMALSEQTMMDKQVSPAAIDIARPKLAIKRDRDPPRNVAGQLYCDHPDCHNQTPTFRRPCEWNKHMDKHDRPYKCQDPDCDKLAGFTYSGGLLRHQREVHKMHTPGKRLMCPFPNCNRSSGKGFTRQENLKEHIRRLHKTNGTPAPDIGLAQNDMFEVGHAAGLPSPTSRSTKRRRLSDGSSNTSEDDIHSLREELVRLRRETQEKDMRLDELEKTVTDLQQRIDGTT